MDKELTEIQERLNRIQSHIGALVVEIAEIQHLFRKLPGLPREYKAVEIPPWRFPPQVRA